MVKTLNYRKCAYDKCGISFAYSRPEAKYCCDSHRFQAFMERKSTKTRRRNVAKGYMVAKDHSPEAKVLELEWQLAMWHEDF